MKPLIDPYAKAIDGTLDWQAANALPYVSNTCEDADLTIDETDDEAAIPSTDEQSAPETRLEAQAGFEAAARSTLILRRI